MWIVRWILIATIIIVILGLALQNNDLVELSFFTWQSGKIPVYMVIYIAFAAGMIVFMLLAIFRSVQQSLVISRSKKTIRQLQEELDKIKSTTSEAVEVKTDQATDSIETTTPAKSE